MRTRKIRHYNIDQTIEETLEESDYENVLDDLIKRMAKQSSVTSSSSSSSSSGSSSKSSMKYPKQLVEESGFHRVYPMHCLAENESNAVASRMKRVDHLEILDECSSEYPLLEHAFHLAKKCNVAWERFQCDKHYVKFVALGNQTSCIRMRSVASKFRSI